MDYHALFEAVSHHVAGRGIDCEIQAGPPVTDAALMRAEARLTHPLPAALRDFYRAVGDGFVLSWQADPDDLDRPFAAFVVPTIAALVKSCTRWRKGVLYTPAEADKYGFPHTADPALAKRTAARMWGWVPVITEGNGDQLCVDAAGPVVFDKHDWLDGGSGDNGHVLAADWRAFLTAWAGVCFQFPAGMEWPPCFRPGGGVDWDGPEFRAPFRIAGMRNA